MRISHLIVVMPAAALAAGCGSQAPQPPVGSVMSTQGSVLVRPATVTNVRDVAVHTGGQSSGIGSAVGAILGGVAGSAIGGGRGSAVASVGGAVAGGIAGQRAGQASSTATSTQVTVRLENGEEHTYNAEPGETYKVGETVKVLSGNSGAHISH
jgi:outer membrane lipoprotein SlyB